MCGLVAVVGEGATDAKVENAIRTLRHRGPNAEGIWKSPRRHCVLGHCRLSIIDLSQNGNQPMVSSDSRWYIVFNGEVYNYLELKAQLQKNWEFRTGTDTEVILAAFSIWGPECLKKLNGMFAFAIWDEQSQRLFIARDRFGVKPVYFCQPTPKSLAIASEIKALHALGYPREADEITWATYLSHGVYDHSSRTFWRGVRSLRPGFWAMWHDGKFTIRRWYNLFEEVGDANDPRTEEEVIEEYLWLLRDSVILRFRADVPIGINLSGGVDSSTLLGLVNAIHGKDREVSAFTFVTGEEEYDELPWVTAMVSETRLPLYSCLLKTTEVPELATQVAMFQDEPFGGVPTLAYAKLFHLARSIGVTVLLDGQGLDEQWCGYDYFLQVERRSIGNSTTMMSLQGSHSAPTRAHCLENDFRKQAKLAIPPSPFTDLLKNFQYRDLKFTKLPRALRFNDRVSMMASTELREPFLDHRLVELALRQSADRKIRNNTTKYLLRQLAKRFVPSRIIFAPKRALQTPQREWLRGPLRDWVITCVEKALNRHGGSWLKIQEVRKELKHFFAQETDNSFFIWQWISLALIDK